MAQQTSYSFKSLTGSIINIPMGVTIPIQGGNIGNGSVHVRMLTDRTVHDVAADGSIMVSYVSANNGTIDFELQQTSILHSELMGLYNLLILAAESGDSTSWTATTISLRDGSTGRQQICNGVSFLKKPDDPHQSTGQKVTWSLLAADVQTV